MRTHIVLLAALTSLATPVLAGDPELPPFDFSDEFYLANGINPDAIIGRVDGTPPGSVIDDRNNGALFNNVRVLEAIAAYDHSGHVIFFYVPGIFFADAFTPDSAGQEARQVADEYKVYEFPRADNPLGAVFPKRQDLIADLSGGYFSNDPLGLWQINLVKYTDAAFNTQEGRDELADLAEDNGLDLDGTPIIRTKSEVERLLDRGLATIFTPPVDGSQGLRWFICPVVEDPRDGAITPDAHLLVTEGIAAAREFEDAFACLRFTGDWCGDSPPCSDADMAEPLGTLDFSDIAAFLSAFSSGFLASDLADPEEVLNFTDVVTFLTEFAAGCP